MEGRHGEDLFGAQWVGVGGNMLMQMRKGILLRTGRGMGMICGWPLQSKWATCTLYTLSTAPVQYPRRNHTPTLHYPRIVALESSD